MTAAPWWRSGSSISPMPRPGSSAPIELGVIPVRLRILAPGSAVGPAGPASSPSARPAGEFAVQVGAFASRARAESLRDALTRDGDVATVTEAEVRGDTFFRVRLGPYPDRQTARAAAQRLAGRGHRAVVVER